MALLTAAVDLHSSARPSHMGGARLLLAPGPREAARGWAWRNMARHASGVAHLLDELGGEAVLLLGDLQVDDEQHGLALHLVFEGLYTEHSTRINM